ncbi:MAG: PadR family transcriptional regulator [Thermodesulfobacteriota bacterium]|nr:PadR family transcriptional regulator [Thermodesulfobacteriota bacterium]
MKTKPSTEYALLGALISGPRHGYEIMRFLNTALGSTWHVGGSQLYTLLKRLEEANLLSSNVETQETRPSKRVFSLMPAGKVAFLEWLHSTTEHVRDLRIEFLGKLFFFDRLSLKEGDKLIEAQMHLLQQIRERIREKEKTEKDPFNRLVLGFKTATVEAWLQWLIKKAAPFIQRSLKS